MKKLGIVAVLLAAGAFAASGLFAQEIKFDGYVNSGLGVVLSTEEDAPDPFIAAVANDSWNNAFRIWLNARYTNEAGNIGAHVRLQASGGYNFFAVPVGYGWFSAFDNILTVKGGIVDDGTWNSGGAHLALDQGEGLGTLIKVSPISGLDLGVGAYLTNIPGEHENDAVFELPYGKNFAREFDQAKYTFNAAYTLPEVFKFIATYRTKSETNVANGAAAPYTVSSRAQITASLLAVPKLKAIVELELDNLQDFKAMKMGDRDAWDRLLTTDPEADGLTPIYEPWAGSGDDPIGYEEPYVNSALNASGKIAIAETFQYDGLLDGDLLVGLWSVQWLSQAEDTDFSFYVNPWVSYAIGSIVPRLDFTYGYGVQAGFNNGGLNWRRGNISPKYDSDYSVIAIRPSVKFNIDSNTFIEFGDLINIDGGPDNTWGTDNSRISNVFYADFKWSF